MAKEHAKNPETAQAKATETHLSDFRPFLNVLHAALMNNGIENAAMELKADEKDAAALVKLCRRAVWEAINSIGEHAPPDATREILQQVLATVQQQQEGVAKLLKQIDREDVLRKLRPDAPFLVRLETDHPEEKRRIAVEATHRYFHDHRLCCFIQASSLAVALGRQIATTDVTGILIHTNSVAFPLVVLDENCGKGVYSFSGPEYDPHCGGWLFPATDPLPQHALYELFHRAERRLDTAFITPYRLAFGEHRIHFELPMAMSLASQLIRHAKRVVLLVTADRVCEAFSNGNSTRSAAVDLPRLTGDKAIEVLICGNLPPGLTIEAVSSVLTSNGVTVHWSGLDDTDWTSYQPVSRNTTPGSA